MTAASVGRKSDVDALGKNLLQHAYNSDGLPEIGIGLFYLLLAGLTWAFDVLPKGSAGLAAVILSQAVLMPLFGFCFPWAVRRIRGRYLIHRFGYVAYQPIQFRRKQFAIAGAAATAMALLVGVGVGGWSHAERWLPAATGLFGGAIAVAIGQPIRIVLEGTVMAVTGLSVSIAGVPLPIGFTILFGVQGAVTLIAGTVVFLRFMRTPIAAGE